MRKVVVTLVLDVDSDLPVKKLINFINRHKPLTKSYSTFGDMGFLYIEPLLNTYKVVEVIHDQSEETENTG